MIRASEWCEISADRYLDERHRNWELAEAFGDVVFIPQSEGASVEIVLPSDSSQITPAIGLTA